MTRGDTDHTHEPVAVMDRKTEEFLQVACGILKDQFIERMEAYACSGVKSLAMANNATRTVKLRTELRELVRSSLRELRVRQCLSGQQTDLFKLLDTTTGDDKVRVPWSNYYEFMQSHHIILDSWPENLPMDPAKLAIPALSQLIEAFRDGTCKWRRISETELEERVAALRAAGSLPSKRV